jgi:hypothetical protein
MAAATMSPSWSPKSLTEAFGFCAWVSHSWSALTMDQSRRTGKLFASALSRFGREPSDGLVVRGRDPTRAEDVP